MGLGIALPRHNQSAHVAIVVIVALSAAVARLELHYNDLFGTLPSELCSLGRTNGADIYITADCGRPDPQVACPSRTCCDACYVDALRGTSGDNEWARAEALAQTRDWVVSQP
jgi:hypothetical protein